MVRPWTDAEKDYVKANYQEMNLAELRNGLQTFGKPYRSTSSVGSQIYQLGLKKSSQVRRRPWIESERVYLVSNPEMSLADLSIELTRTESAIHKEQGRLINQGRLPRRKSEFRLMTGGAKLVPRLRGKIRVSSWLNPELEENKAFIDFELARLKNSSTQNDLRGRVAVFRVIP